MPAYVVAGLLIGDEGKGITTSSIAVAVKSDLIVRYNGGPQAAHNVISSDGRHHCFRQFGSGMFIPGVRTYLSSFMLVSPPSMLVEDHLLSQIGVTDAMPRTFVHEKCIVITPYHRAVNRLVEIARGPKRHGSTGFGLGQARRDSLLYDDKVLMVGDLRSPTTLRSKLEFHKSLALERIKFLQIPITPASQHELAVLNGDAATDWFIKECEYWVTKVQVVSEMPSTYHNPVFEGAQGVLLDEKEGFFPYTTWTNTTFANAEKILEYVGYREQVYRVGVTRCYHTRHGAGPFPSEHPNLINELPEPHNATSDYAGSFRVGHFDMSLLGRSKQIVGRVDYVAVNHLDRFVGKTIPVTHSGPEFSPDCAKANIKQQPIAKFLESVTETLGARCAILGYGSSVNQRVIDRSFIKE